MIFILLHQLEVFARVADKSSFSKAAEDLFLSQSTVSTHINNLEKRFGQKLFDRLGKQTVLTPFGRRLYPWARDLLMLKEKMLWEMKDWTGAIEGHLNIAASTVPAQYAIPFLLGKFLDCYKGIKFVIRQSSSEKVAERLMKGEAELGILGKQYHQDDLKYIPFAQEKLVLVTPTAMHYSGNLSILDFKEYPFLFRESDSGTQANLEQMLGKANVSLTDLRVIGYFDSLEALKESVKEGIGISIISSIAATDDVNNNLIHAYELRELSDIRTFYFAYHRKRTLSPLAEVFINFSLELSTAFMDRYALLKDDLFEI